MVDLLLIPGAVLYLVVIILLFVYGLNFFYLTFLTLTAPGDPEEPTPADFWPRVTVQLPIYNEMYVASRLIRAAAGLDYPPHLLEIQVLDDSTDETVQIVGKLVAELRAGGVDIHHLRRPDRQGYKSGALAHGLSRSRGEFLAIFDADFLPQPDFLKRTLPVFQNPAIGFVQTRWGHINRGYSFLTQIQSLAIDAHFMVEQFARSRAGFWFNFNGTAGVWRRSTIEQAGGWSSDTLTEDLDLSYRAFFRGWRACYLREVVVPAELPVSFSAYRRQQHRWARGSLECARKYLPQVWRSPIPLGMKFEATLHLLGYGVHVLLCALVILHPIILLFSLRNPGLISLFGIAFFFNATTFAQIFYFLAAQKLLGQRWWQRLPSIIFLSAVGAGMMMNTVRASLEILGHRKGIFERTPKFGIVQKEQNWTRHRYQLTLDPVVYFELAFALLNLATAVAAINTQNWTIAVYALLFFSGLAFTSGMTVAQSIAVARARPAGGKAV
jgi:cellulose synthase/poly-beta-1,6-N-acetylglucosamine synthase-like glycosyltransferase